MRGDQVIEQYWKETGGDNGGKQLDFDTACDYVEKQIATELEAKAERLAKTKKFGAKWQKAEDTAKPQEKVAEVTTMVPDTISSRVHAPVTGQVPAKRKVSEEESLEQAAILIQWGK